MKKHLLLFSIILMFSLSASAISDRKDSIDVWGEVSDMFSGDRIERGVVLVTDEQGMEVIHDSIHPKHKEMYGTWGWDVPAQYKFKLPRGGNYKIQFLTDGYVDTPQDLIIPDRRFNKYVTEWNKNYTLMKKPKEHVLNGVTVKATRIKMVVKGDTVEYDADAFNLAEGSMLDKLIEAMPGMTLNSDGEIYHNGRKVESLLVNGRDFFNGDPKAALQNLPAYTVKKVQVYRRDDEGSYMIKDSLERENKKKLVVDVKLKKEYSKGWIFNSDLAYGTHNRWSARGVGIYFTDALRFYIDGNLNNANASMWGTGNGDMGSSYAPEGEHIYRSTSARLEYTHKLNPDEEYTLRTTAGFAHDNDNNRQATSQTTYLTGGDTYSRSRNQTLRRNTSFNAGQFFMLQLKDFFLRTHILDFSYARTRTKTNSLSATFHSDPMDSYRGASLDSLYMPLGSARLEQILNNSVRDRQLQEQHNLGLSSSGDVEFLSPLFGNNVSLGYHLNRNSTTSHTYQHYLLDNRQASLTDFRNVYNSRPAHNYNYNLNASYEIEVTKKLHIQLSYSYDQAYNSNISQRYRLDSLSGWGEETNHHLGETPSMRDSLLRARDIQNSYHTSKLNRDHTYSMWTNVPLWKDFYAQISARLNDYHSAAWDTRSLHRQHRTRSATYLNPDLAIAQYSRNDSGVVTYTKIGYSMSRSFRDAETLLDITDNTDPLFVTLTNPSLKDPRQHSTALEYGYSNAHHVQNYNLHLQWGVTEHSVANAVLYDRASGITTYQPRNISGNWNWDSGLGFERSIDRKDKLRLSIGGGYTYTHSVDYITDLQSSAVSNQSLEDDAISPSRSVVHNHTGNANIRLTWTPGKHRIELGTNAVWRNQLSRRQNFTSLHAADLNYSLRANGPILWGFEYQTDLTLYSRRGYNDHSMNDDNWVWNLSLTRRFLKNKALTIQLEARDLLAQLNNVRNTVNSQGVTETWYNSVPRFLMLHIGYRFNTMPKKKANK